MAKKSPPRPLSERIAEQERKLAALREKAAIEADPEKAEEIKARKKEATAIRKAVAVLLRYVPENDAQDIIDPLSALEEGIRTGELEAL